MPDELGGWQVPGVELGETPNVELHPFLGLCAPDHLAVSNGVLAGVLGDHVVGDFEDEGLARSST